MNELNTFFIPYSDKTIVYQPLNRLAFIGNSAMVALIENILNNKKVNKNKFKDALAFLDAYSFFTPINNCNFQQTNSEYKPTICVLCMTSDCNFRCTYCFANGGETSPGELPLTAGKKAIDIVFNNSAELNSPHFVVSFHGGGEPTLPLEKLQKLTSYARDKDKRCKIELTSNGYWSREKADWILSEIDCLTLSFDGIQKVQDRQRPLADGRATFNNVMNNIKELDEHKSNYGIRLTVTRESLPFLEDSIHFLCKETNCNTFQVEPAFGAGRALKNNQSLNNNNQFSERFLNAYDIAIDYGRQMYYSGARPFVITNNFCTAHDNALVVTPQGQLSSCYEISGSEHPLAKVFHFGELTSDGKLHIDFEKRNIFKNKIRERKILCKKCFCYWHCAGDCPAKTILPGCFDNNTFSERCDINREITKELLVKLISNNGGIYKG